MQRDREIESAYKDSERERVCKEIECVCLEREGECVERERERER